MAHCRTPVDKCSKQPRVYRGAHVPAIKSNIVEQKHRLLFMQTLGVKEQPSDGGVCRLASAGLIAKPRDHPPSRQPRSRVSCIPLTDPAMFQEVPISAVVREFFCPCHSHLLLCKGHSESPHSRFQRASLLDVGQEPRSLC